MSDSDSVKNRTSDSDGNLVHRGRIPVGFAHDSWKDSRTIDSNGNLLKLESDKDPRPIPAKLLQGKRPEAIFKLWRISKTP
jgi:hypothetical protein